MIWAIRLQQRLVLFIFLEPEVESRSTTCEYASSVAALVVVNKW